MFQKLKVILEMIKFPHTVFALPFAFTAAVLAANGMPAWDKILWITLAMVGARSGAMGMNRMLDADIDAKNPRTKTRAIPAGLLTKAQVGVFSVASFALLVYASAWLKCHEPAAFACALLNSQPMGFYAPSQLVHQRGSSACSRETTSRVRSTSARTAAE